MTPPLVIYLTIFIAGAVLGWFGAWVCGAWRFGSVQP